MPASVYHALTATTPDNTSYEIRPQAHWNASHVLTLNATGSEISGAFSNANGLSFGLSAGAITGSYTQSAQAFSAEGGSTTFQTLGFSNANGLTFSNSNGSVVGSYTVPGATVFSNSNNVSFGLNGSTVTATATFAQTNQSIGVYGSSNTVGQSSSSTVDARSLTFRGAGIASVGLSAGEVVVSVPSAGGSVNFSAGATSNNLNAVTFSNANGVSFGLNASTITGSVAAQTNQSVGVYASSQTTGQSSSSTVDARSLTVVGRGIISVGMSGGALHISASAAGAADGYNLIAAGTQTANTTGTVVFSNSNGITFGMSQSSIVTASHNGLTSQSNQALSAGNGSFAFQTASFSNANGVSFSTSAGSAIVASHNGLTSQSNQALSGSNGSFTFQTATFGNLNGASFYSSNGSMVLSYTAPDVGTLSAGTSIATLGQVILSDSNGISFGASNNTITASYNPFGAGISGGNTAGDTGTVSRRVFLAGGANITLSGSTNGGSQTVSIVGGAGGGGAALSAGTQSVSTGTVVFSNSNGISFGMSGSSRITASHDGLTSQSGQAASGANGSFAFQTLSFSNANGLSFGTSAGSAITASHNALTSQSNQAFSAGGGSSAFQTLSFSNGGGVTFTNTNGQVGATIATTYRASNDAVGLNTAQTNVTWTVNSSGISLNAGGYAGTATGFTGANISGSMTNNTAGLSLSLSVAAPGAAAEQNAINLLGANTAGNTTATGSTLGFSGVNITLSGTNNSQLVFSAPATSSLSATGQVSLSTNGSTISIGVPNPSTRTGFFPAADIELVNTVVGQASLIFDPQSFPDVQFDRILVPIYNTNPTNSSGSHTISAWVGLYTRNASTLSLLTSASRSVAVTHSGTQGSYSRFSAMRNLSIGMTATLTDGKYWMGFVSRTTSGGANGTYSNICLSQNTNVFGGEFGVASAATNHFTLGQGFYTATTSGMPASVAFSEINGTDANAHRMQALMFASSTV